MSRVIGLTGGIACGKSHLSRALGEAGAVIIDADRISHALTARDGKALPQLRQTFGDGIFGDGGLDRRALGELVFSNPEALARLDRLMHPLILAGIREELQAARDGGAAVIVLLVLLASHKKNQQPQAPYMYYGNVSTKTYHFRSCRTLTSVGKGNLAGFHTKEEAQRKGYKPCNICKP